MLCSRFAIDENASTGLVERKPLTSISELGDYFDANAGLRGVSSARRALMFVQENAASPREIDLAMRLCLPQAKGGFGFAGALLNYRIDLGSRARLVAGSRYYVADMCWPKEKLVVEYDSDLHLSSKQLAHDAVKRGALTEMGYRIITVTRLQLDSPVEMRKVAIQIAHRLRKRLRIRSSQFRQRQEDLFGL
ncbi:DUF559 domain-containing protein [Adlercreutzia sp. ZJ138]|uniref:DUF559 domain-containing protein n=1 Tax=Adlercreutzia sp. ZJ138 TaxID=2709405 RepID=UPI0013EC2482|nr:DUF559 domain-containing protein [Adlercreutzia sp. ZJ138]